MTNKQLAQIKKHPIQSWKNTTKLKIPRSSKLQQKNPFQINLSQWNLHKKNSTFQGNNTKPSSPFQLNWLNSEPQTYLPPIFASIEREKTTRRDWMTQYNTLIEKKIQTWLLLPWKTTINNNNIRSCTPRDLWHVVKSIRDKKKHRVDADLQYKGNKRKSLAVHPDSDSLREALNFYGAAKSPSPSISCSPLSFTINT